MNETVITPGEVLQDAGSHGRAEGVPASGPAPDQVFSPRELRVFVRASRRVPRPFLERLLRLDIWGDTLLAGKVEDEMAMAKLILLIVFVFETLAWTLLFNFVFYGGQFTLGWRTCPAFLLGGLWGLGVYAIDKSLITSDLMSQGLDKWLGFAGRFALVAISVVFTSQPIDQLVFQAHVEARLKTETLISQAAALKDSYDREEEEGRTLAAQPVKVAGRVPGQLDSAEEDKGRAFIAFDRAEKERQRLEREQLRAKDEQSRLWTEARRLEVRGDPGFEDARTRAAAKTEKYRRLTDALHRAQTDRDEAAARGTLADQKIERLSQEYRTDLAKADEHQRTKVERVEGRVAAYRALLNRIRNSRFGDEVEGLDREPIGWNEHGFIERIIVLDLLTAGEPPRWPDQISRERRMGVASWAGMPELGAPALATPNATTRALHRNWWLVTLLVAAIPLLSFAFKLTTSKEMRSYYSLEAQARAGNAEALLHRQVQVDRRNG